MCKDIFGPQLHIICLMTCSSGGQLLLLNHKYCTTPFHPLLITQPIRDGYQYKLMLSFRSAYCDHHC